MPYDEETMERMDAALAGGALRSTGADRANDPLEEIEAVREPLSDFRIEDTCCGKCHSSTGGGCYVDQITGA